MSLGSFRGRNLIVNFWGTWCPPCVAEMPMLEAFWREQPGKGWQVVGIAVDQPDKVSKFIAKHGISFHILMAEPSMIEFTKQQGNTAGGLPFTLVISPEGEVVQRKMGALNDGDLASWRTLGSA